MKFHWQLTILIMVLGGLLLSAGCAKKQTSSAPPAEVEIKDDTDWKPAEPVQKDSGVDEAQLAAEAARAAAAAKVEAVAQLTDVTIRFAFDSYELDEEARAVLAVKATIMRQYDDVRVVIEGHCDERGTEEYNLALGERRARAAYEHLVILGVAPERMSIVSFGEERPIDSASNETAWAKNRRAEFVVQ